MSGTIKASVVQDGASATANLTLDVSGNVAVGNNLTVAGTQTTTGTVVMGSSFLRNRIINGDMRIDQRNAGASVTVGTTVPYITDRFAVSATQASKCTAQQTPTATETGFATRVGAGFTSYLSITSSSSYSVLAADVFAIKQSIEGFNFSDFAFGTANAKTVTLSFWAYSSLTGTFGGSLTNFAVTRCYPFSYSIPTANTWTQISITIAGDTSGTWVGGSTAGAATIWFGLGVGTTASGTAGAWAGTDYRSATGATSVVGTNGATFYITGVQLEVGTVATPFERQLYSTQLAQCQRYYQQHASSGNGAIFRGLPQTLTSGTTYAWMPFAVVTRAVPTMTVGTPSYTNMSGASWANINLAGAEIGIAVTGTNSYAFIPWTASAEL